jgi:FkbM family methyltransferase
MHEYVTTTLSGTFLEGPARRVYATGRALIPGGLLPPAAIKARDYDRMTLRIARIALAGGGSAIDIGAHEGDILRRLARMSPGPHWAFEPIPAFAERLRRRFPSVAVEQAALADYSVIVRPEVEDGHAVRRLAVRVRRLDDCVPQDARVAFMKIDVEGAEAAVLRGARDLLRRCQPVTVFECGSANLPRCVAALEGTGLEVSFLADYLLGVRHHAAEVMQVGRERGEYYYVAFPVS